jgi:hypothetical protein
MSIFRRNSAANDRRAMDTDVRAVLLLAAVRAFREAERTADGHDAGARERLLIAEFAEPVVVPAPLRDPGR